MKPYNQIKPTALKAISTGITSLDDFLSLEGGIIPGYLLFLTGSSGAGKTFLTKLIQRNITSIKTAMLQREVSADLLAKQLQAIDTSKNENCFVNDSMTIQEFLNYTSKNDFKLIVVDSLQCCRVDFPDLGEKAADEEIYRLLRAWTTVNNSSCIIIGQSNKDGSFNGNNSTKHMFDCYLEMIYEPKRDIRYVHSSKNRMGGTVGTPLYYRFTDTEDILEWSFDGFDKENQTLNDHLLSALNQFVRSIKKMDKASYHACCNAAKKVSLLDISEDEMIIQTIITIQRIIKSSGKLMKAA